MVGSHCKKLQEEQFFLNYPLCARNYPDNSKKVKIHTLFTHDI